MPIQFHAASEWTIYACGTRRISVWWESQEAAGVTVQAAPMVTTGAGWVTEGIDRATPVHATVAAGGDGATPEHAAVVTVPMVVTGAGWVTEARGGGRR